MQSRGQGERSRERWPEEEFGHVLGEAISASGMTLVEVAEQLAQRGTQLSPTMLGFWRSGRSLPGRRQSLQALWQLDEILDLPTGTLANSLDDQGDPWLPQTVVPDLPGLREAMDELGLDHVRRASLLLVHDSSHIGPKGFERTIRRMSLVEQAGCGSPLMVVLPPHEGLEVSSPSGQVHWRLVDDPAGGGLLVGFVELDEQLVGQVLLTEVTLSARTSRPLDQVSACLPGQARYLVVDASFDVPVSRAWHSWRRGYSEAEGRSRELTAGSHVQVVHEAAQPGVTTLRWSTDELANGAPGDPAGS